MYFLMDRRTGRVLHSAPTPQGIVQFVTLQPLAAWLTAEDYVLLELSPAGLRSDVLEQIEAARKALRASTPLRLTQREQVALRLIVEGKSNKEMADAMRVTERTVKFFVSSLLAKFQCRSRIDLGALGAMRIL